MKKIIHISDLHFGRVDEAVLASLRQQLLSLRPDFVVISGDLTQRAKKREYQAGAEFLASLNLPYLIVPGNHDQPLYRVWERLFAPLRKYKKFVSRDYEPVYVETSGEFVVVGISTPRRFRTIEGSISAKQVAHVQAKLTDLPEQTVKILVAHHPIIKMKNHSAKELLETNFDLLLSGHDHLHNVQIITQGTHSFIDCAAGTTISTREKNTPNSFNLITLDFPKISVTLFNLTLETKEFSASSVDTYIKDPAGWRKLLT